MTDWNELNRKEAARDLALMKRAAARFNKVLAALKADWTSVAETKAWKGWERLDSRVYESAALHYQAAMKEEAKAISTAARRAMQTAVLEGKAAETERLAKASADARYDEFMARREEPRPDAPRYAWL